jgi:hypothetical protein
MGAALSEPGPPLVTTTVELALGDREGDGSGRECDRRSAFGRITSKSAAAGAGGGRSSDGAGPGAA